MVSGLAEKNGNGFIRISSLGGVDRRHLYGQRVVVHGRRNGEHDLPGIIGALPVTMLPEVKQSESYELESLLVDTGLSHKELVEKVSIGDVITFSQPSRELVGSRMTAKAMDNRASVAAVTVMLDYLKKRNHEWDVMAVATVQEETGLIGALTSSHEQQPDIALAIDVTFGQGPGATDSSSTYKLGDGPVLGLGPHLHDQVMQGLHDAAKTLEMKVHDEPHIYSSGTDASALQVARAGIPTGLVSIPLRYMHTMVEVIDTRDVKRCGRLMGEFAARLDEAFIDDINKAYLEK
jgi:endoglucanase